MNCRAPLLGKQLLQTPNPRTWSATPLEPSLTPRLLHPLLLSPSEPELSPSPPPFTYTQVVLTRALVLYHCASSLCRHGGPGFGLAVSAVCRLTRARPLVRTHVEVLVWTNVRCTLLLLLSAHLRRVKTEMTEIT